MYEMLSPLQVCRKDSTDPMAIPFSQSFCVSFIEAAQNPDGGWGYRPGGQSSVEASCWALLALGATTAPCFVAEAIRRGVHWLEQAQLPAGCWPSVVGQRDGCWVTPLACIALQTQGISSDRVARGLRWLCNDWPGEAGCWWRIRHHISPRHSAVRQNHSLYGWGWTRGTASWVEPTSYSLLLLRSAPETALPANAARRRRLGERMLYDRMCPGGGWNSGNPLVYGVSGEPRVGPTVWALLALSEYADRTANQLSMDWLEKNCNYKNSAGSLALAQICLKAYGRSLPDVAPSIEALHEQNEFLQSVLVFSWVTLALSARLDWIQPAAQPGK